VATMGSLDKRDLELPMALDATEAKRIAERLMASAWIERDAYEFALRPGFLRLDPTDLARLDAPGGAEMAVRLTQVDTGANYELRAKAVRHVGSAYASDTIGDRGHGFAVSGTLAQVPSRWIVPDSGLLQDRHDLGGVAARRYFFAAPQVAGKWDGLAPYASRDGSDWDVAAQVDAPSLIGACVTGIGSPRSVWSWDDASEIEIRMRDPDGDLASISERQVLDGGNAALIVDRDSASELIQLRDVAVLGKDRFRLSRLLRGRRGSDHNLVQSPGRRSSC